MNFEDFPEAKPVFDEPAVKTVLAETGLPLAPGTTVEELRESLEDIARQHYWNEFNPVGSKNSNLLNDPDFTTEMLADQRAARPV